MENDRTLPSLQQAKAYLEAGERRNPGGWVAHSVHVAEAAAAIAARHPRLDPQAARVLGLLHDIGRREGLTGMRHVLDGYRFLLREGFPDAARICLTHSFPIPDVYAGSSEWDCTPEELHFVQDYLDRTTFDEYDRLFQLCDSLALPTGFCLLEKRWVDVLIRYENFNRFTIPKWKAIFRIKSDFENTIGCSVYQLLPGVVENTFGF